LASITEEDSPSVVFREDGHRYTPVKFSVRDRDLNSTIEEVQSQIAEKVPLPPETRLEWAGEINELHDAMDRLKIMIPLTLFLIGFLVYGAVKNWLDTLISLINIPVACTGGLLALLITGEHFSVSAAMGFVSIFGIAIQDALLMVTYYQQLHRQGLSVEAAAKEAAEKRFRASLMTTLVAMLGLLPAALSHAIGAQAQRALAIVVIGGSLQLAILTRLLQPPLRVFFHRLLKRRQDPSARLAPI